MEWRWPSNVVHHCGAEEGSNPYGRKKVVKGHMAVSPKPSPGQRLGGTPLRTVLGSQFGEFFPIGRTWDENLVLSFENHEGSGLQLRHAVPPPRGLVDPWWILNIAMGHKCLISRFGGSCRGAPSLRVRVFSLHARPNPWPWNDRSGGKKNTGGNLQNTVFFFFLFYLLHRCVTLLHCWSRFGDQHLQKGMKMERWTFFLVERLCLWPGTPSKCAKCQSFFLCPQPKYGDSLVFNVGFIGIFSDVGVWGWERCWKTPL